MYRLENIFFIFVLLFFISCNNSKVDSPKSDEERVKNMMIDASAYAHSLESFDYKTYIEYLLPLSVMHKGGEEKYLRELQESNYPKDKLSIILKDRGILIEDVDGKYYSVLKQEVTQYPKGAKAGEVVANINVVAESQDGGVNWKFDFMTISDLEQFYPENLVLEISKYLDY